jgi:hypothetical protein
METKADKLLKQVKKQQKQFAAYERAKERLHLKQWRAMGQSDAALRKQLKTLGIDPRPLLKDSAAMEKKLKTAHKTYMEFQPPPAFPGLGDFGFEIPPDPNIVDVVPPAYDGFGGRSFSDEDCGFNLALGETNFKASYQGSGWGLAGGPSGAFHDSTLVFRLVPPRAGNIVVDVYIDFNGSFAISADDRWYTSTHATLRLRAKSRLFQHYWEYGPTATVLDESGANTSNSGWLQHTEKLSYTTTVSANDPVLIFVAIELLAGARSSYARSDVDFRTGAERRVKVPLIRARYF